MIADFVNRQDVRVIEGRGGARFVQEAAHPLRIAGELGAQHFQRDRAAEGRIDGLVDLAHAAAAQQVLDLVAADAAAGGQGHAEETLLHNGPMTSHRPPSLRLTGQATLQQASLALGVITVLLTVPTSAQQDERWKALEAQIDRIYAQNEYSLPRFGPARWLDDGTAYTTVERGTGQAGGSDIVRYDAATGARSILISNTQLIPAGSQQRARRSPTTCGRTMDRSC